MEKKKHGYIGGILYGLKTLLTGMKVTLVEFFTKKTTEKYPENRKELVMAGRFRGTLTMPLDANGNSKCIACGLCQMSCPNDTLRLEIGTETDETTGKTKKAMVEYRYNLGSCMFCQLCVNVCPTGAIEFGTQFEHAVFDRSKLIKVLNRPGMPPAGTK